MKYARSADQHAKQQFIVELSIGNRLSRRRPSSPGTIIASSSVFEQRRIVLPNPEYRCLVARDHLVLDITIGRHGW